MKSYSVSWSIDIEADNAQEAALQAEQIQRFQIERADGAQRGVFVVQSESGESTTIDLMESEGA